MQKCLQEMQTGGSSNKAAIEKLEKEIEKLRKEKSSSKNELRTRLEQLRKETKETGEVSGKSKLNSEQIQCIIDELEKQLKEAQTEIENKEQRIQDLEKQLCDLKNLSIEDQESLQDEIQKLRQLSSKDNQQITDLVQRGKSLAVLTERNAILEQRLEQLERRRKQEAFVYEDRLIEIRQSYQEEQERLIKEVELNYAGKILQLEEKIKQLQKEIDELRARYRVISREREDEEKRLNAEIKKSHNTLLLYNQVVAFYEVEFEVTPVQLEQFRKDVAVVKEIMLGNENYCRDDIECLERVYFEDQICHLEDDNCMLRDQVIHLEKELKSLKDAKAREEKLIALTECIARLQASLEAMMSSLSPEQQRIVRGILDNVD
ncbi:hypothetical protein [Chlamydia crocodili]|uniref:hypothetical protein n=1 Tax=Chlamydia crocodili TaxID=2766982 RepID=UPI003D579001